MKTSTLLAVGFSLALLGAGCGSAPTETTPAAKAPTKPPARGVQLNEVAVPSDFPTDVPRYAGAKVINAVSDIGDGSSLLSLTSDDEAAIVLSWHDSEFVRAGFSKTQDQKRGTVTSREYSKDGLKMILTVDDQAGTTNAASLISIRRSPDLN
ncbi:hypothetical protein M0Q28_03440 [Patescibacteria group bacterium]|jgi:hypothetical protein|nr:hypothetical protein [Patescibacteria group bacterium]